MESIFIEPALSADFEGIGYALEDLAGFYKGDDVPTWQNNRLWLAREALKVNKSITSESLSGKRTKPQVHPHLHASFALMPGTACALATFANIVDQEFCCHVYKLPLLLCNTGFD